MMKILFALFIFLFLVGCSENHVEVDTMNVTSAAFQNGGRIPDKYTCAGDNVNPPLNVEGIPENAKSLVLIVEDPDAPRGNWVHWIVWNIFPVSRIPENKVPKDSVQGVNDYGKNNYGGPCPPSGTHRYFFRVYALDTELKLNSSAKKADLVAATKGRILAKGELMGTYSRG